MHAAEIVVHEIHRHGCDVVFDLLGKAKLDAEKLLKEQKRTSKTSASGRAVRAKD
jgi:hypothetical protein